MIITIPFSGRLGRRAINPTPPKRVTAWGDGPLGPEVMYPVAPGSHFGASRRNYNQEISETQFLFIWFEVISLNHYIIRFNSFQSNLSRDMTST